jgi:hypothetical protein
VRTPRRTARPTPAAARLDAELDVLDTGGRGLGAGDLDFGLVEIGTHHEAFRGNSGEGAGDVSPAATQVEAPRRRRNADS